MTDKTADTQNASLVEAQKAQAREIIKRQTGQFESQQEATVAQQANTSEQSQTSDSQPNAEEQPDEVDYKAEYEKLSKQLKDTRDFGTQERQKHVEKQKLLQRAINAYEEGGLDADTIAKKLGLTVEKLEAIKKVPDAILGLDQDAREEVSAKLAKRLKEGQKSFVESIAGGRKAVEADPEAAANKAKAVYMAADLAWNYDPEFAAELADADDPLLLLISKKDELLSSYGDIAGKNPISVIKELKAQIAELEAKTSSSKPKPRPNINGASPATDAKKAESFKGFDPSMLGYRAKY